MRNRSGFGVLLGLWLGCACGGPAMPATDVSAGDVPDVVAAAPKKYDILWVIDQSSSMVPHQRALAKALPQFLATLNGKGNVDVQTAVVTVQQIADTASATGVSVKKVGAFNQQPATSFPPNAMERYLAPCSLPMPNDVTTPSAQCRDGFDFAFTEGKAWVAPATSWLKADADDPPGQATAPPYGDVVKHYAPNLPGKDLSPSNEWRCSAAGFSANGSFTGGCHRHCSSDKECQDVYGDATMICYTPGGAAGAPTTSGCMVPPDTKGCPEVAPAILDNDHLDLFRCIATVGGAPSQLSGFEGGLRSAWIALDPVGANCPDATHCQNTQFIRPDATLVVVFVSDDDDCSVSLDYSLDDPDVKVWLPMEDWGRCQSLGDAVGGNTALNEGNCLYVKSKQVKPDAYKCPGDCAALDAACLAEAAAHVAANARVDKRIAAVAEFAAKFKSLKAKPEQLIVAAISGDSADAQFVGGQQLPASAQVRTDRAAYFRAMRVNGVAKAGPSMCASATAVSGYGSRYFQLAALLGDNGWAANLCDDLPGALAEFAAFLADKP